ncbi:ABC transporter family protein [Clostridium argentinense CDC 2741]|uniref:ABC transporter family protein n=1 Tax=Clostridium argentinense CDC 2741 TaxID=1418104 RepID=A0A0C1RBK5_9CLOT|nr:energy-coupling factor transporter ATPase [Clostridium argentinense]HAG45036.1 energy-coupling factor transporter ATPase [Clostridium sp.]KIE47796.1 ABC transporter family protein [Clostridium argentinense CDC 2741]NFF41077.1 energy-coupling factor transporter ATPase [Clostridium argentinense]NFP51999.1 energy-coupling factor transporter ATPase [Clostridium argentinense]NFP73749.1 energy-coupling factor transporter ATPase [Clostridium argentinense]
MEKNKNFVAENPQALDKIDDKEIEIHSENLVFKYDNNGSNDVKVAIDSVNIDINKGDFVVILGHNGSGKSTFAKHINALLIPTEGKLYVGGLDTTVEENVWNIRNKAGMVFQNPDNQIVATIVEEDVAFGPENLGVEPEEIRRRVDDSLKRVNMYEYKKHGPHLLSGGQKQRVAIAGILAMMPQCIVLDEPTAMLDPSGRKEVIKTVRDLNKEYGITIVLITHYMEEAVEADKIYVMDSGKIVIEGTPKEVFKEVETMKKLGLDVPQMTELAYELKKNGVDISEDILTIDEMVNALCQLK